MADNEWITGKVSLTIKGNPVEMEMTVPAFPVKPYRMLPVIQQMTNSFVAESVADEQVQGRSVSCKAGCGACCRQPVPIAEAEVYQIAELVESMPEPRRSVIKQRFADGVAHFRSIGWFSRINDEFSGDGPKDSKEAAAKAMDVVMDYFREGIPCPFLENESCSIHPSRPLSCREYLVTTPAENCASPTAETIRRVEMMAQPSKALKQFTATEQLKGEGLVTLIRALELAEKYSDNYPEKTGDVWMSEFFGSLAKAGKPAPTEPPAFKSRLKKNSRWRK